MTDDPKATRLAAAQELRDNLLFMRAAGMEMVFYDRDGSCDLPDYPNDGEGMLVPVTIGSRGNLSKNEAKLAAAIWRQATGHYPKACFMICLFGSTKTRARCGSSGTPAVCTLVGALRRHGRFRDG
jgi:hypothetical protein